MRILVLTIVLVVLGAVPTLAQTLTISGPKKICGNAWPAVLTASTGFSSYRWSTGAVTSSISVNTSGTYTVTATTAAGVQRTAVHRVDAVVPVKPRIGNPVEYICNGDFLTMQAPAGFTAYRWSTGETTSSIRLTVPGRYALTATDSNGCQATSDSIQLVVVDRPKVSIKGVNSVCVGAVTISEVALLPGARYSWQVLGGTIIRGQGTNSIRVEWIRSGRVDVTVSVPRPDGDGTCDTTVGLVVRSGTKLRPEITYAHRPVCPGETATISLPEGYMFYRWNTGATTSSISVNTAGRYWCEVFDSSGCDGISDTATIIMGIKPDVQITGPLEMCTNQSVILDARAAVPGSVTTWLWSTGARTDYLLVRTPGVYTVVGTSASGCTDTATYTVRASEENIVDIPATVDFGATVAGNAVTATVTLGNKGTAAYRATGARLVRSSPSVRIVAAAWPLTIQPGGTATITLECDASVVGVITDTLAIDLDGLPCPAAAVRIPVTGEVTAPPVVTRDSIVWTLSTTRQSLPVGSGMDVPIRLQAQTQDTTETDVYVTMHWDHAFWQLDSLPRNVTQLSHTINGTRHTLTFFCELMPVPVDTTIIAYGHTFLDAETFSPVVLETLIVFTQAHNEITLVDGSIEVTNCFIDGRVVEFGITGATAVRTLLFDVQGRIVAETMQPPGSDNGGWIPSSVPSGCYQILYITSARTYSRRVVITR